MKPTVVCNSTPLIALSKIQRLHILQELFGQIFIPEAVFNEVALDKKKRAGHEEVFDAKWIKVKTVSNQLGVSFLSIDLDLGEAEAIALSKEVDSTLLLIDDRDGRKVAKHVGIPITGTVGILLRYYRGNREAFKLALDELMANGFRLAESEYEKFLDLASHS